MQWTRATLGCVYLLCLFCLLPYALCEKIHSGVISGCWYVVNIQQWKYILNPILYLVLSIPGFENYPWCYNKQPVILSDLCKEPIVVTGHITSLSLVIEAWVSSDSLLQYSRAFPWTQLITDLCHPWVIHTYDIPEKSQVHPQQPHWSSGARGWFPPCQNWYFMVFISMSLITRNVEGLFSCPPLCGFLLIPFFILICKIPFIVYIVIPNGLRSFHVFSRSKSVSQLCPCHLLLNRNP